MKQAERASIMRIVSDLIEADGIIDTRELLFLDSLREKYGIKKEDEILAASYTFADALKELQKSDDSLKHDLIGDFNQVAMSDDYCAREEALLILAIRCCLTINIGSQVSVLSIDTSNINFEDAQILYVESEYDENINEQIQEKYREIATEIRLAGFDFVYLPKLAEHYNSISETDLFQITDFLYPKVSYERLQTIVNQLRELSTERFCKDQLAAKLNVKEFSMISSSFMIKVGDSFVNDNLIANFLVVEIEDDALGTIRAILDLMAENYHNLQLDYLKEETGRFIFKGFYKQIFDILMLRKGVKSSVVVDPMREQIFFPEADVKLEKIHRREKALYALFLLESASGGINFNKPETPKQLERYEKRMKAVMRKYQIIYKKFGGDEEKAPNIIIYEIRAPMIALLKRQLMKLNDVLYHAENYIIQRNLYGNYGVKISPSLCNCCEDMNDVKLMSDSEDWKRISAL